MVSNDLISRSALMRFPIRRDHYDRENGSAEFISGIETVLEYAGSLPAVDAVSVVHGRWYQCKLNVPKGKGQTYLVWKCSNCHKHGRKLSDYCPNCGAKMDGEEANG